MKFLSATPSSSNGRSAGSLADLPYAENLRSFIIHMGCEEQYRIDSRSDPLTASMIDDHVTMRQCGYG